MGKIALYIFVLLVPLAGALEGTEGVASTVQPTETSPETSRTPDGPAAVTGLDPPATLESVFPPGDSTINVHVVSIGGLIAGIVIVFILIGFIVWMACCFSPSTKRLARRRTLFDLSSTFSYDGDDDPSLSSDKAEAPEDDLNIQGLSSADQTEPLVKFRGGKPGVSFAPGDILEL